MTLHPTTPTTFRILGVQQVAIGGTSKQALAHLWHGLLGLPKVGTYRSEKENVDEDILVAGVGPFRVEIDLMEPIDCERKPRVDKPALNHIGLWVDNIDKAVAELDQKGVRFAPGGIRVGAAGHRVCFIHPRAGEEKPYGGGGVLIELVEAPAEVIEAFDELNGKQKDTPND